MSDKHPRFKLHGISRAKNSDELTVLINNAQRELDEIVEKISSKLDASEKSVFFEMLEFWHKFRASKRDFYASAYRGGTNSSIAGAVALLDETHRWIDELTTEATSRDIL